MSRRKTLIASILGNQERIKESPNIKDLEEAPVVENEESQVPEEFKEYMGQYSEEELIVELFQMRQELSMVKRELELVAFKNTKFEMEREKDVD